jgi:putative membrane protein
MLLPHINAFLNALVVILILWGYAAIRRGNRTLHPVLMKSAVAAGLLFLAGYIVQTVVAGHSRFPGNDWVRTVFLLVLGTHTILAAVAGPLILWMVYLGVKGRFDAHKKLSRLAYPIWVYVSVTGVLIYWMNNFLRPVS